MPVSSPTFKPIISTGAKNIQITNLSIGVDEEFVLPEGVREILIRAKNAAEITIAQTIGGDTFTVSPNCSLSIDGLELSSTSLFINSNIPATMVEILIKL